MSALGRSRPGAFNVRDTGLLACAWVRLFLTMVLAASH